jgi:hypothetical protein
MLDILKPFLVAVCAVVSLAATGCDKDSCTAYEDDRVAKFTECKIQVSPTSTTTTPAQCTAPAASLADCLDKCLIKVDCQCWQNPALTGCADKNQPYIACTNNCKNPTNPTTTSSGSTSASSTSSGG